jgi:two-component system phosphate regulon sensor histidine kinase PhoR
MFDPPVLLPHVLLPSVLGTALAGAAGALVLLLRRGRAAVATANRLREAAQESEQTIIRRLRLAAHDLRGIGMNLHGHADHLIAGGHAQAAGIATAAADLLDIADDLQDHTVQAGDARVLREEQVDLFIALTEAIAAVGITIGPGRRNWRITPELDGIILHFDPRALRHMLSRVLADAVRNTRQDDWIEISLDDQRRGLVMTIADEGSGSATPEAGRPNAWDSRGIGLRLTLARALMAAHGGRVEIEASAGVGTRVSLIFPESRVRRAAPAPSRRFAA